MAYYRALPARQLRERFFGRLGPVKVDRVVYAHWCDVAGHFD
ncbi:hypothetical protein [Gemmata massiliana]|nr:hypothetical protein [Gemmata massiliana]